MCCCQQLRKWAGQLHDTVCKGAVLFTKELHVPFQGLAVFVSLSVVQASDLKHPYYPAPEGALPSNPPGMHWICLRAQTAGSVQSEMTA